MTEPFAMVGVSDFEALKEASRQCYLAPVVYLAMKSYAGKNGFCWPTREQLSLSVKVPLDETGDRMMRKAIATLKKVGLVDQANKKTFTIPSNEERTQESGSGLRSPKTRPQKRTQESENGLRSPGPRSPERTQESENRTQESGKRTQESGKLAGSRPAPRGPSQVYKTIKDQEKTNSSSSSPMTRTSVEPVLDARGRTDGEEEEDGVVEGRPPGLDVAMANLLKSVQHRDHLDTTGNKAQAFQAQKEIDECISKVVNSCRSRGISPPTIPETWRRPQTKNDVA